METPKPVTQQDIHLANTIGVPAAILHSLTPVQQGWIGLSKDRVDLTDKLTKDNLAVQQALSGVSEMTELAAVQTAIAKAKSIAGESKERRLFFTNKIKDKIIEPLMSFEKQNDEIISKANETEFKLRKAASDKAADENKKNVEEANYKAHIINEYSRIATQYKIDLDNAIVHFYKEALGRRSLSNAIPAVKQDLLNYLKNIQLVAFVKFARTHTTDQRAVEIFNSVPKYSASEDYNKAIAKVEEQFILYDNDLKNAAAAIEAINQETIERNEDLNQQLQIETAVNVLQAAGSAVVVEAPKVKKNLVIVFDSKNEQHAMNVSANWVRYFNQAKVYLRVSSWDKLNLGQIAIALAKLKSEFPEMELSGLELKEVEK